MLEDVEFDLLKKYAKPTCSQLSNSINEFNLLPKIKKNYLIKSSFEMHVKPYTTKQCDF